ncbi:hypothetical protein BT69DRAFT_1314906 [Atractiella rhizophila]|nr:hypothetical protein BT69DRAFT_1314906 [Atractiella rhizophila]
MCSLGSTLPQFFVVSRLLVRRSDPNKFIWGILTSLLLWGLCDSIAKEHFVTEYGRRAAISGLLSFAGHLPESVVPFLVADAGIVITTHVVYITRIWNMLPAVDISRAVTGTKRGRHIFTKLTLLLAACLSLTQIPFTILVTIRLTNKLPSEWFPGLTAILSSYLACAAGADLILCITFVYNVKAQKGGFMDAHSWWVQWARIGMECMGIPTVLQIARWVLVQTMPEKAYHYAVTYVITKLYTASVLALYTTVLSKPEGGNISEKRSKIGGTTYGNTSHIQASIPHSSYVARSALDEDEIEVDRIHLQPTSRQVGMKSDEEEWKHDSSSSSPTAY